jgi:preprotein translocase subunit YajC
VVTIGGLYGTVVGTDAETVDLQIAPNVNVTYARSAIARAVSPAQDFGDKEATDTDEADLDPVVDGTAASDAATKENIAKTQTATNPKS